MIKFGFLSKMSWLVTSNALEQSESVQIHCSSIYYKLSQGRNLNRDGNPEIQTSLALV